MFGVSGRSESEIESNAEYHMWRIYVDGDPATLQKIEKVVYHLDPSFPKQIIETTNWQNNFEYKIFGYGSFELEFQIYIKGNEIPYSGKYYLNISRSNNEGVPVVIP